MFRTSTVITGILMACFGSNLFAQDRGPVTNLPLPRFVSMKAAEGYARRGPSKSHRIDWVYKHRSMPLMITGEYEHWRRVQDIDGQGGWMHFRLLSGVRTVMFKGEKTPLRRRAYDGAEARAFAEQGVIGKLDECNLDWCKVFIGRQKGWVLKTEIWGVTTDELRD
jgi:SH3-like domain-containing protein